MSGSSTVAGQSSPTVQLLADAPARVREEHVVDVHREVVALGAEVHAVGQPVQDAVEQRLRAGTDTGSSAPVSTICSRPLSLYTPSSTPRRCVFGMRIVGVRAERALVDRVAGERRRQVAVGLPDLRIDVVERHGTIQVAEVGWPWQSAVTVAVMPSSGPR